MHASEDNLYKDHPGAKGAVLGCVHVQAGGLSAIPKFTGHTGTENGIVQYSGRIKEAVCGS